MRIGEILGLIWDRVNMKESYIVLKEEHTKTGESRTVYFDAQVRDNLEGLSKVRSISNNHVFTYQGEPIKLIKTAWATACRQAQVPDV